MTDEDALVQALRDKWGVRQQSPPETRASVSLRHLNQFVALAFKSVGVATGWALATADSVRLSQEADRLDRQMRTELADMYA